MISRSSRRNEIGGAIGDQLRAIYDEVLNEPIADRFFELLGQLEMDSKLVAHQENTWKFASSQSTARTGRNATGIMPKSLVGRGRQASEISRAISEVAAAAEGRKPPRTAIRWQSRRCSSDHR